MARIFLEIDLPDGELPPTSLFKARAVLKRVRITNILPDLHTPTTKVYMTATTEALYSRCPHCWKTYRRKKDGGLVRHNPCD